MSTEPKRHDPERCPTCTWKRAIPPGLVIGARVAAQGGNGPSRHPWLILLPPTGEVVFFEGTAISGVARVNGSSYSKNGKWSHTTYRLSLAAGVRGVTGWNGWGTNTFAEGLASALGSGPLDTAEAAAAALGVTPAALLAALQSRAERASVRDTLAAWQAASEPI